MAYYTRNIAGDLGLKEVIVISNVDFSTDISPPESPLEWQANVVENTLLELIGKYEPRAEKRVSRVSAIVSCEPKLDDYKLMQMCGLMPLRKK